MTPSLVELLVQWDRQTINKELQNYKLWKVLWTSVTEEIGSVRGPRLSCVVREGLSKMSRCAIGCKSRNKHPWPRYQHEKRRTVASRSEGLKDQFELSIVNKMGNVRYTLRTGEADIPQFNSWFLYSVIYNQRNIYSLSALYSCI